MCNAYEKFALTYLVCVCTSTLFVVIFYTGEKSDFDLEDISETVIKLGLKDISRYPYPNDILERPDLGECCNGLCSGDHCYVGDGASTLLPTHCNNCCLRLTLPSSCTGSDCACYANLQS
jgi:hypothetical protein